MKAHDFQQLPLKWSLFLSTELCAPWTLKDLLSSSSDVPSSTPLLQKSLLLALNYLHTQGVVHRDIKPANILFQLTSTPNHFIPKLADFGLSFELFSSSSSFVGDDPVSDPMADSSSAAGTPTIFLQSN
ncbi:hypothetical protein GEMRC1_013071 [Eukaryota sp. GEM-RC1]